ncbi:MBG domain-containing protein [Lactobacillus crispatus]|uniref:YSIRK-type signal peptide-containing protein n=1 Tax=Lactobacillus crispatus TaxID=47770 RepID=A0A7H9EB02_9LACO|nr:MBG domain-containing protein [Lactobacillus crispatus]QLL74639.1 YSIRK-type signal peptide-containing protein [Lactobacillus crispatus]
MIFNKRDMDTKQRFSIRKLSVGVCSVLLSTLFLTFTDNNMVKADVESGKSNVVTQEPSRSAEQPSPSAEQPSSGAEQPSRSAEQPSRSAEQPSSGAEHQSSGAEHQSPSAEQPSSGAEHQDPQKKQVAKTTQENGTDTDTETTTRRVTVNYLKVKVNDDGSYTEDGQAAPSAVLEVYYSRTATKDLVTNKTTYTPWLWNTKKGDSKTPGYRVISGDWTSLPENWNNVVADVPTLKGYTAYTGGPADNKNEVPANQFVFPTWNGSDGSKSDVGKESLAYTDAASVYEAKPTHTIWYIPNEITSRTVTAHMKYADAGDLTGQNVFPDEQIKVFYQRTGTLDPQTGTLDPQTTKITYSDWTWDTDAGDEDTPGFEVISGTNWANLGSKGQPQSGSWSFDAPGKDDYTTVTQAENSDYNTMWKGYPVGDGFKDNNTSPYWGWAYRNEFTVYYVPNSNLSKTVVRTITINEPGQKPRTVTQSVGLTRHVYLNKTDTGVVYGDWSTDNWGVQDWGVQDVPIYAGYNISVTQTVEGASTSTPLQLVNGRIPAETVNGDTKNTQIVVTYGATATAKLTGNGTSVYTGSAITAGDLNNGITVTVIGPNVGNYILKAGDVEFSSDNGQNWTKDLPINVGNYQVRLTPDGEAAIKTQFGNNSISWVQDGNSTITGSATYNITPSANVISVGGTQTETYKGSAYDVVYNANGTNSVTVSIAKADGNTKGATADLTEVTLDSGDFIITNGPAINANATGYNVALTEDGLTKIQQALGKNYKITNSGSFGKLIIKQQVALKVQLYGSEKSTYNGQPVSFNPTNTEEKKNFGFYNVEGLTVPTLTSDDFEWVNADGNTVDANGHKITAPTNVGTYYLKLNKQGEQAFADANKNYSFVDKDGNSTITGRITYNIDPAELVVGITGSADKVFDNQNAKITQKQIDNGDIKLVWGDSNTEPTGLGQFTLTPDDLEVVTADGKPALHANVGKGDDGQDIKGTPYEVRLTPAALEKIKKLTGANNYAISQSTRSGEYFIYAHKAEMTLSGNQTTTYGIYLPFDKTAYQLELTNWVGAAPAPTFRFNSNGEVLNNGVPTGIKWHDGDLYVKGFSPSSLPTDVGSYKVKIAQRLINAFQKLYPDYDFKGTSDTSAQSDNGVQRDGTKSYDQNIVEAKHEPASYVIQPAETTVTINNAQHVRYGESTAIKYGDGGYTLTITAPQKPEGATTVDEKAPIYQNQVTLSAGDLEFVTTPSNVGKYEVKLSEQGLKKLADLTGSSNYDWTQASSARANFFVDQMPVNITVAGNKSVDYGSQDWLNILGKNPSGYTLSVATDAGSTLTYKAQAGDLVFNQTPGNVGTYNVELSAAGLKNIATALGTNYAYPQAAIDVKSHGTLTINPGTVTVTLDKKPNTTPGKTYDGDPATIDDNDAQLTADGLVTGESLNTANLTPSDYEWLDEHGNPLVDKDGNPIKPTNAGTYYITLTQAGKDQLQKDNPNYKVNESGQFAYVISPKQVDVTVQGGQESANTTINNGKFSLDVPAGVTIPDGMTYDFANGTPNESGVYKVALSPTSQTALTNANPNYKINIKPGGKFTLDATVTFTFQDTDDNNKQVGDAVTKTGVAGSIAKDLGLSIPAGYKLATGESLPGDYTFGKDLQQNVFIKLAHNTITVTPDTPKDKIPTGKVPGDPSKEYEKMESLTATPTRTINVTKPDGTKFTKTQTVDFTRTATFDEVTGEVVYSDWTFKESNSKDSAKSQWDAYSPQAISDYTMHIEQKVGDKTTAISSIDAAEVTEATGDVTITVTYVAINPGGNGGNGGDSDDTDPTITKEPIKPDDHRPEVPVKTPNETTDDTKIDTTPKDQDPESGPAVIKGYKESNVPLHEDMNNSAPARNNNSISPKGADTYAANTPAKAAAAETEENSGKHELPQTGEKQNEAGIFGILAMVLGLFGLADHKKKKDE